MASRVFCYAIFVLAMAIIIPASLVAIVLLYLPYVALRALYLMARGKVKLRMFWTEAERREQAEAEERQEKAAPMGPMPF
jgi:hypothetical protein